LQDAHPSGPAALDSARARVRTVSAAVRRVALRAARAGRDRGRAHARVRGRAVAVQYGGLADVLRAGAVADERVHRAGARAVRGRGAAIHRGAGAGERVERAGARGGRGGGEAMSRGAVADDAPRPSVEVVYATAAEQRVVRLEHEPGLTAGEAARRSGLFQHCAEAANGRVLLG